MDIGILVPKLGRMGMGAADIRSRLIKNPILFRPP
jgi:hypothetical protein